MSTAVLSGSQENGTSDPDLVAQLIAGTVPDPDGTGLDFLTVPTKQVVISNSLVDQEATLVKDLGLEAPYAIVSDPLTHEALGSRVERALSSIGRVLKVHLGHQPSADIQTVNTLEDRTATASSLIAVGSGTINDLCKFVAFKQNKPYVVFATAPSMNGYTSVNAAISEHGLKKSVAATAAQGVFMDLRVLADAPVRMIRSGLGDSICRPTAQSDWLLSHLLLGSMYRLAPFSLLAEDEEALLSESDALICGDLEAMGRLARTLILSGFGMTICGGSFPASQGEHLISHYVEMMPPTRWEQAFHGEQIAVATCVMARLQEKILTGPRPQLKASAVDKRTLVRHFGEETGDACWKEFSLKRIDAVKAEQLNTQLEENWSDICEQISQVAIPSNQIESALARAGAPTTFADLKLERTFFRNAVSHAREIRNRYTFLDLAGDAGRLDADTLL